MNNGTALQWTENEVLSIQRTNMKNLTYDSSIVLTKKEINYVGFEANY